MSREEKGKGKRKNKEETAHLGVEEHAVAGVGECRELRRRHLQRTRYIITPDVISTFCSSPSGLVAAHPAPPSDRTAPTRQLTHTQRNEEER